MKRFLVSGLTMASMAVLMAGCASVQRGAPVAPALINVNMNKGDYTVLGTVKGTSTVKSYLLGIVQVVDEDKVSFLGIKTWEDQYALLTPPDGPQSLPIIGWFLGGGVSPSDRAYYKALAATPDADAVAAKSWVKQNPASIPLLYSEETVTFTGKALKFKSE